VKPRPKIIIIMIMGHEFIWWTVCICGELVEGGRGSILKSEEDRST
jgi:hypothetical protein